MAAKQLQFGEEARRGILAGVVTLSKAVKRAGTSTPRLRVAALFPTKRRGPVTGALSSRSSSAAPVMRSM